MPRLLRSALEAWDRLHPTVAATLTGLLCAAGLRVLGLERVAAHLDFTGLLLRGFLPFLLFAGALHIDPASLRREAAFVGVLSTAGVVIATFFVGFGLRWLLEALGRAVPLVSCLLFGALISPTDPVAVLAIFRRAKVSRDLAITVGAESLFNDAIAVVMYASLLGAAAGQGLSLERAVFLFLKETGGGLILGLLLAWLARRLVDAFSTLRARLGATAAVSFLGYTGVNLLGVSGLLATILAGMAVGGRDLKLKLRWTQTDGVLNVVVFFLLGLAALKVPWSWTALAAGLAAVPLVLAGRAASVGLAMAAVAPARGFVPGTFRALTWGGLRGAIPLALALSLPPGPRTGLLVVITYVVGLFSLVIQGSTI